METVIKLDGLDQTLTLTVKKQMSDAIAKELTENFMKIIEPAISKTSVSIAEQFKDILITLK
jgi:hypothetical protein